MFQATASTHGFQVVATNAVDYLAGTQAATGLYVGEKVEQMGSVLHADVSELTSTVAESAGALQDVGVAGFGQVSGLLNAGFASMGALSALNIATQAGGFFVVARKLEQVRGSIRSLHSDLVSRADVLLAVQRAANAKLETLVEFAQRTLHTQERILETLVSSRTVEAQQLIRQGWDNLRHGYAEEAFDRFTKSLDYDNTVYLTHAQLALLCAARGEHGKAEDHYRRAIVFSSSAGDETNAYAHVQYAHFLEDQGRLEEARSQVELGLQKCDRNEWRFFEIELYAKCGEAESALIALEALIERDAIFFAAAMASPEISALGPQLVSTLTQVDQRARTAFFEELDRHVASLDRLAGVSSVSDDILPSDLLDRLRREGASLLRVAVAGSYDHLVRMRIELAAFGEQVEQAIIAGAENLVVPVRKSLQRIETHERGRPPDFSVASVPTVPELGCIPVILAIKVSILTAGAALIAIVPAYIAFRMYQKSKEDEVRAIRAQREREEKELPEQWSLWLNAASSYRDEFQMQHSLAASQLRKFRESTRHPAADRILSELEQLRTPEMTAIPPWLTEGVEQQAA